MHCKSFFELYLPKISDSKDFIKSKGSIHFSITEPLFKDPKVIAVDGGMPPHKIDYWIGDGDSGDIPSNPTLLLSQDKDFSDLAATLNFISDNFQSPFFIKIFHALGGRRDHEIINREEIFYFLKSHQGIIYTEPECIFFNIPICLNFPTSLFFSLYTSNFPTSLDIKGARYSGTVTLTRPSHGLSNYPLGSEIKIDPRGNPVAMICSHEKV